MNRIPDVWPGWTASKLIGSSLHSNVYLSSCPSGNSILVSAIKIIDLPKDEDEVARLRASGMGNEAIRSHFAGVAQTVVSRIRAVASLGDVPNLVHVDDFRLVERGNGAWSVFVRMEPLEQLPDDMACGTHDVRELVRIGVDVCKALETLHRAGILHLNVKPQNILVSFFGQHLLADAGLGVLPDGSGRLFEPLGSDEQFVAPETDEGTCDERSDIFSLGTVLYYWLSGGKLPSCVQNRLEERSGEIPDPMYDRYPDAANPPLDVDEELAQIIYRAVADRPEDRWQSAAAFGAALQGWLDQTSDGDDHVQWEDVLALTGGQSAAPSAPAAGRPVSRHAASSAGRPETSGNQALDNVIASHSPNVRIPKGALRTESLGDDGFTVSLWPYVYVTNLTISHSQDMIEFLALAQRCGSLLVFAGNVEGPALEFLTQSELLSTGKIIVVRTPGFGDRRTEIAGDISAIVGAGFPYRSTSSTRPAVPNAGQLGRVDCAIVTADNTYIQGCGGVPQAIENRIRRIANQIETTRSDFDRDRLRERLGMLERARETLSEAARRGSHRIPIVLHG